MGELFNFPEWMGRLTPFGHIPQIPVEDMDVGKTVILTIVAVILLAAGSP